MIYLKTFEGKNKNITCGELKQGCLDYLHYLEDSDIDFSWYIFCNSYNNNQDMEEGADYIDIQIINNKYFSKDSISPILNLIYDYLLRVGFQIPEWNDIKRMDHGKFYYLNLTSFHNEHGEIHTHKMR